MFRLRAFTTFLSKVRDWMISTSLSKLFAMLSMPKSCMAAKEAFCPLGLFLSPCLISTVAFTLYTGAW